MQFKIDGEISEIEQPTVQQVQGMVQNHLQADRYYSCLIVNGNYVYDDYAAYISDHLAEIDELELVTQTLNQMLYNNLVTARGYLDRLISGLPALTDHFYGSPSAEDWKTFGDFVQGVGWIGKLAGTLGGSQRVNAKKQNFLNGFLKLQTQLKELDEAVVSKDTVLIADTIQYELLAQLEDLKNAIGTMLLREGNSHDPA